MAYLRPTILLVFASVAMAGCSAPKKADWRTVPDDGPDVPMSVIEEMHRQTEVEIAASKKSLPTKQDVAKSR